MGKKSQKKQEKINSELTKLEIEILQKKTQNLSKSEIVKSHIDFLVSYSVILKFNT